MPIASWKKIFCRKAISKRAVIVLLFPFLMGASAELTWDIPTLRENGDGLDVQEIGGYEIAYKQTSSNTYNSLIIDNGGVDQHTLQDLQPGNYEFKIAVFDVDGLYSDYSEPVFATLDNTTSTTSSSSSSSSSSSGQTEYGIPTNGQLIVTIDPESKNQMADIAFLGHESFTASADGSLGITIPTGTDAITFSVVGYAGSVTTLVDQLNFANDASMEFSNIVAVNYYNSSSSCQNHNLMLLASSPDWPGIGAKTLYFSSTGSYSEGFRITLAYWQNVDQSDPIVGVDSSTGQSYTNPWTSSIAGVSASDMSVVNGYGYATHVPTVTNNSQTQIASFTQFNSAAFAMGYKLGEGAMQIAGTSNNIVPAAFVLRASAGATTGTINSTLGNVTSSSSGQHGLDVTGTVSQTLNNAVSSSSGNVGSEVTGSVNQTLNDINSSAQGQHGLDISGSVSESLEDVGLNSSGQHGESITGSLSEIIGNTTSNSSGQHGNNVSGTISENLNDTISVSIGQHGEDIAGTITETLGDSSSNSSGNVGDVVFGSLAELLIGVSISSSGQHGLDISGTSDIDLEEIAISADGYYGDNITGSIDIELTNISLNSSGIHGDSIIGSIDRSLDFVNISAFGQHGLNVTGSMSSQLTASSMSSNGFIGEFIGSSNIQLSNVLMNASGTVLLSDNGLFIYIENDFIFPIDDYDFSVSDENDFTL